MIVAIQLIWWNSFCGSTRFPCFELVVMAWVSRLRDSRGCQRSLICICKTGLWVADVAIRGVTVYIPYSSSYSSSSSSSSFSSSSGCSSDLSSSWFSWVTPSTRMSLELSSSSSPASRYSAPFPLGLEVVQHLREMDPPECHAALHLPPGRFFLPQSRGKEENEWKESFLFMICKKGEQIFD